MKANPEDSSIDWERFREEFDNATRDPQERPRANLVKKVVAQFLGEPDTCNSKPTNPKATRSLGHLDKFANQRQRITAVLAQLGERQTEVNFGQSIWRSCVRSTKIA